MPRSLDLLLLAAALLAAPDGLAARKPRAVEPAALVQGALACRGLPDDVAAADRRIVELGWPRVRTRERQANGDPLRMFERDGLMLVLTPPDQEGHTMSCNMVATVPRSVSAVDLTAAVSAAVGHRPAAEAAGSPLWALEGGQVMSFTADGRGGVFFTFWYPRGLAH
jgi:hypothetical protein